MRMSVKLYFKNPAILPSTLTQSPHAFDTWMDLVGVSYRKVARRDTLKINIAGNSYFIKKHFGVGWIEIFKNLLSFKRPVISARNEVDAIQALTALGIPTTPYVAHGIEGISPAYCRSFVVTEDLGDILTLEDLALGWQSQRPSLHYKRALIRRVAEIAKVMHTHAIYHRDFYICHFCLERTDLGEMPPPLHVLDLHRTVIYDRPDNTMQKKDLSALYFSAMDAGLTRGDRLHFLKHYTGFEGHALANPGPMYIEVLSRAQSLYIKYQRKKRAGIAM